MISNQQKLGQVNFLLEKILEIGADLLQLWAAFVIPNRGNGCHKSAQLLPIRTDLLQIGAAITNWNYYCK